MPLCEKIFAARKSDIESRSCRELLPYIIGGLDRNKQAALKLDDFGETAFGLVGWQRAGIEAEDLEPLFAIESPTLLNS